jgi:hypothetical protein
MSGMLKGTLARKLKQFHCHNAGLNEIYLSIPREAGRNGQGLEADLRSRWRYAYRYTGMLFAGCRAGGRGDGRRLLST